MQNTIDRVFWLTQNVTNNLIQIATLESANFINPKNMEFFIDLILDNDMVQDELKAKLAKSFYDMALIVAFRYHSVDNFSVSLDMLKLAAKLLKTHVSQSF